MRHVFSLLTAAILLTAVAPSIASAADCQTAPVWSGTGATRTVTAGGSIQSAIDASSSGDTVTVANGSYSSFSLTKNVRVMAQNRYGATLSSGPSIGGGGWVEGFVVSNGPVRSARSGALTFINNRILEGSGQMFMADTGSGKIILWGNDVRDPNNNTDYGFQFYATHDTEVCHNYLWGQFDQAVSFKEGDVNPTIAYNTLEGGEYAGFFIGQNGNSNNLGPVHCNPCSVHHNWIGKSGNGFRSVGAIRPWHFTGTINVHDNVVVGSQSGLEVNCGPGPTGDRDGCGDGQINLTNNAFAGKVDGSTPMLGCFLESYGSASTGTNGPLTVTADGTRCWDTGLKYAWNLPLTLTNTTTGSNPQTSPVGPVPRFDPDLHLLGQAPPPPPPGDTTPPSSVANFVRNDARTEADPGRIWFTWDKATDNVGVDHYREYRDGLLVDANVSPTLANPGAGDYVGDGTLAACSSHTVGIEAVDAAANIGPRTTVTMKTGGCPTTSLVITNLARDPATTQTTIWFTWTKPTAAVAYYREYRDGMLVDPNASNTLTRDWVGGSLMCGTSHSVGIEAIGTDGTVGPRNTLTMTTAVC